MTAQKPFRSTLWTAVRIIVPLSLIGWLVTRIDWAATWPLMKCIPIWMFGVSTLLYLVSQVVIAVRWHFLLRFQKVEIPFSRLLGLVFVGIFASNFLPTTVGGDVVKMAGAAQGQENRSIIFASWETARFQGLFMCQCAL